MGKQQQKALLSTNELAERLGFGVRTIYTMVQRGEIPKHCYRQMGRGDRRYLLSAVTYFEAHGRWPETQAEQAEWSRSLIRAA